MTIPDLISQLPAALDAVEAQVLLHSPGVYPRGPLIRFLVRPPKGWLPVPAVLDPVGVISYARTGRVRSLLEGLQTAISLGIGVDDALTLLHAADAEVGEGQTRAVRDQLVAVIEGWRSQPSQQH